MPCPPGWTLATPALPSGHLTEQPQAACLLVRGLGRAYSRHAASCSVSYESPRQGCAQGSRGGRAGQQPGGGVTWKAGGAGVPGGRRCPGVRAVMEPGDVGGVDTSTSRSPTVGRALGVADAEGPGDPARGLGRGSCAPPPRTGSPRTVRGASLRCEVHLTLSLTLTFPGWLAAQRVSRPLPPTGARRGVAAPGVGRRQCWVSLRSAPCPLVAHRDALDLRCWQDTWRGPLLPLRCAAPPPARRPRLPPAPRPRLWGPAWAPEGLVRFN